MIRVPVERLRTGDQFFWAGVAVEVHRVTERPTAGVAVVVVDPSGPRAPYMRRLFYKPGEVVELVR